MRWIGYRDDPATLSKNLKPRHVRGFLSFPSPAFRRMPPSQPCELQHSRGAAVPPKAMPYPLGYFASEGGFTAGPLLFPGSPGTLDESCWRTARLWSLMSEPVVSPEGFTAGPLLLPGLPGIPGPEFCPLGTVVWPPPDGAVVCAEAGSATIASAVAPISSLNMANSLLV